MSPEQHINFSQDLSLEYLMTIEEIAELVLKNLNTKEVSALSLANKKIHEHITSNHFFWCNKIINEIKIKPETIYNFVYYCLAYNVDINYFHFYENLYKHKDYIASRPISNHKLLYAFAFQNHFSKQTTDIFKLSKEEIKRDNGFSRNEEKMAYLVGNPILIAQTLLPLPKTNADIQTHQENLAIFAARGGHVQLAKRAFPDFTVQKILEHAILSGSIPIIKKTLSDLKKFKLINTFTKLSVIDLLVAAIKTNDIGVFEFVINKYRKHKKNKYNIQDKNKQNLLHLAAIEDKPEIIKHLLEVAPLLATELNIDNLPPIFNAFRYASLSTAKLFFEEEDKDKNAQLRDNDQSTLLWYAMLNPDKNCFAYLVNECGCSLDHHDNHGKNIVHQTVLYAFERFEYLNSYFIKDQNDNNKLEQFLNTPIDGKHVIEVVIRKRLYSPAGITYMVQYLEKHGHLTGFNASHIYSQNLLYLFAMGNHLAGVEYALTELKLEPTEKLIEDLSAKIKDYDYNVAYQQSLMDIKEKLLSVMPKRSNEKQSSISFVMSTLSAYRTHLLKNKNEQSFMKFVNEVHEIVPEFSFKKLIKLSRKYLYALEEKSAELLQPTVHNNNNENASPKNSTAIIRK